MILERFGDTFTHIRGVLLISQIILQRYLGGQNESREQYVV